MNKRKKGAGKKVYKGIISGEKKTNIKSMIVRGSKRMLKRKTSESHGQRDLKIH